ncbi:MAG: cytidylate kinase family protein [Acidobacteriota bacterium]
MSVVILSSDPSCPGDEIASRVSSHLGYECLGADIEAAAASDHGLSTDQLRQALSFSPPLTMRLWGAPEKYLAYFQASLVAALCRDDVLYSGAIGHMLVTDVSHVVKVKVTAELEDQVVWRAASDRVSEARARESLLRDQTERRKWFTKMFGVDGTEPTMFDLVVNVSELGVEGAGRAIEETVREVRFKPVTYSRNMIRDQELACRVKAGLVGELRDVAVTAKDGEVTIHSKTVRKSKQPKVSSLRDRVLDIEGVSYVAFG